MLANNDKKSLLEVHASEFCCALNLFCCALITVVLLGISGCGSSGGSSPSPEIAGSTSVSSVVSGVSGSSPVIGNADILPTQRWTLTNDSGDVAYVVVTPFTTTGTFTESCNSPGWWLHDSNHNRLVRIPLNGTVTHSGQSDAWEFTISELTGGGVRVTGQGTGKTTDGAYPSARNVQGTVSGTATSPQGTKTVLETWTWSGNDYTVWN